MRGRWREDQEFAGAGTRQDDGRHSAPRRSQAAPQPSTEHEFAVTAAIRGHNPQARGAQCPSGFSTHKRKANMKKKTPSNPLPLAESLNLSSNAGTAQEQTSQNSAKPKRQPKRNARRKSPHARRPGSKASRDDSESRWNRIKGHLAAKVAPVDQEKLHEVLLGCGVAVGIRSEE